MRYLYGINGGSLELYWFEKTIAESGLLLIMQNDSCHDRFRVPMRNSFLSHFMPNLIKLRRLYKLV